MRKQTAFLILLMATVVAGCASRNEGNETPAPDPDVRVNVRNDAFWEANVYLLQGATRRRLGTVGGHSTGTFTLPRHLTVGVTELRFVIDFIGRRTGAVTETILAAPGDEIELTIRE